MILSLQAFAPAAILLLGGVVLLVRPSATMYVVVQVLALLGLLRLSQLATSTVPVPLYEPLADVPVMLRLDRLSLFFATAGVVAAVLIALPRVGARAPHPPYGWLALAQFGAISAIMAGNLQGLAAGWGMAVAAILMLVVMPHPRGGELRRPSRSATRTLVVQLGGAVLLLTAAVAVEGIAGTAGYDAVPTGVVDNRVALLLVAAPFLALASTAGLIRLCRSPNAAALMFTGVTLPMSTYALARTFDLAAGVPLGGVAAATLTLASGCLALLWAASALWAPDLGATLCRALNALALALVSAFALGGPTGIVALLVGFLSLQLVAGASLMVIDAGGGRLPGQGDLPRWVLGVAAVSPLAALGGLVLGLGLDARLMILRRLVETGAAGALLGPPLVLTAIVLLAAAWAAGRFGGGTVEGRRAAAQLLVPSLTLLVAAGAEPSLRDLALSLGAASARVPLAELRSGVSASLPGARLGAALGLAVMGVIVLVAARAWFHPTEGLRGSPDMLPPRLAVAPGIIVSRTLRSAWHAASAIGTGAGPGVKLVLAAFTWAAAVLFVVLVRR
ncbi:MAG: hypothetical protein ABR598_05195 [Candidatus Dormibacteria bacterium]